MIIRTRAVTIITTLFMFVMAVSASDKTVPVKVACVGDSITFGFGIKDRATKSYPSQLGEMLGKDYDVKNFGVSGTTILTKSSKNKSYVRTKQFKAAKAFNPDIVIIKLGTNDAKIRNWQHKEEFVSNYVELINAFQALDSKPTIWVCNPTPAFRKKYGIDPVALREEVTPKVDDVANITTVKVIDLYEPLKDKAKLVPDFIHPNSDGAKIIAETVFDAIRRSREHNIK
ncbi:hypothetical protein BVX99_02530 [bacterium F16]|nr:hypothetical protein BVX99_02530 [bacterium F16]